MVYLLSTTQLIELTKIPVLVDHFKEHRSQNSSITLLGFLDMHYAHGCPKDADYDKDMELPFKIINYNQPTTISFCSPFINFKFLWIN